MRNLIVLMMFVGISGFGISGSGISGLGTTGAVGSASAADESILLANAMEAAIGTPAPQAEISDHYCDPDGFIKYIIRKPPVLA